MNIDCYIDKSHIIYDTETGDVALVVDSVVIFGDRISEDIRGTFERHLTTPGRKLWLGFSDGKANVKLLWLTENE